ncbi:MAG: helix-turn-helix domain-containing protein [Pseudonocardiaceae bacterium]
MPAEHRVKPVEVDLCDGPDLDRSGRFASLGLRAVPVDEGDMTVDRADLTIARRRLGAHLATYRTAAGVSQPELGQALGRTRSTVSKIEHGTRGMPARPLTTPATPRARPTPPASPASPRQQAAAVALPDALRREVERLRLVVDAIAKDATLVQRRAAALAGATPSTPAVDVTSRLRVAEHDTISAPIRAGFAHADVVLRPQQVVLWHLPC